MGSRDPSHASKPFDHQLDAALQQQGGARGASSAPPSKADGKPQQPAADARAKDKPQPDQAASALAGAMLTLASPPMKVAAPQTLLASGKTAAAENTATDAIAGSDVNITMPLPPSDLGSANTVEVHPGTAALQPALVDAMWLPKGTGPESSGDMAQAVAMSAVTAPAVPSTMHALQLPSPVGSHAFGQELAQQVTWLGGQEIKQARIRLHPEELGPLDVKVNVTHGRVDVTFNVQHPAAATAVQQSLAQLGHMLAQHGLNLGHAEVGQHPRGDQSAHHGRASGGPSSMDVDEGAAIVLSSLPAAVGLLDAFA
jgi:flagellar hook-length control protein FliK